MSGAVNAIRGARRSIAARLMLMLMAVFVIVLTGVGVHLYQNLGSELAAHARTELYGKMELVRRALREMPSTRHIAAHRSHLNDILFGQYSLRLAILDGKGIVLYQSSAFDASDPALLDWIRDKARLTLEGDLSYRGSNEFHVRVAQGSIGDTGGEPVWIAIASDVRDYEDLLNAHVKAMLLTLALGAVAAALGGVWVIRWGLTPVRRLAAAEERISANRLATRFHVEDAPLELEALVRGFNAMLDRLNDSFRRISEFSSDLAHELRTPINSLIGHAQVALSRPRAAEEYRGAIESIAEDGERVARILRDMLFLARADNASAVLRKERFELHAELESVMAFFEFLADERGVRFAYEGRAELLADRAMIQRAIGNLLSNALWHTPRGETINAAIRSTDHGEVCLEISNPGPGIAAKDLPRVFDRFYQADPARGDSPGRTGLGLAIVKSIMELHGGSVEAASTPDGLTTFRLKFRA